MNIKQFKDQEIKESSKNRNGIVDRLVAAARAEGTASDLFDESFGGFLGLNRTDARCVDIVQRFGRMTLGRLAEEAGLTTGAVTTAVDRLEQADCLQRVRDADDRRKIYVELSGLANQFNQIIYDPIGRLFGAALCDMSEAELETVSRYLELSARIHRDHADLVQTMTQTLTPDVPHAQRLEMARAYGNKAKSLVKPILDDWQTGKLPDNAFVSGSSHHKD